MSLRVRLARSKPIRILRSIAMKCWAFSGTYILACFLLYWLYGGISAFFLLCFATTSKFINLTFLISIILMISNMYLSLSLQVYCIIEKINLYIVQNRQLVHGYMFLHLQYLVYLIKVYTLYQEMVQCYTCSLFLNQRTE